MTDVNAVYNVIKYIYNLCEDRGKGQLEHQFPNFFGAETAVLLGLHGKASCFFDDESHIFLRPFRGHCFYYNFSRAILQEKNGKLELVKTIKSNTAVTAARCKKWRFLHELPVNERGKINGERIREIFNTNVTYPYIIDFNVSANSAYFDLIFPKNSSFFEGHFTEMPILPGVVQLFFVKEFIKDAFNLDFVPQKVKKVKFSSIIRPDEKVRLNLVKTEKSVDYKFTKGETVFSSGTFVL